MTKLSDAPPVVVANSGRSIPGAWSAGAFLSITVVAWIAAGLLAFLIVGSSAIILNSDREVGSAIAAFGRDLDVVRRATLTWHYAGGPIGTFALMAVATIWLLAIKRWWWALYLVACGLGGLVIAESMKHLVARTRPSWPDALIVESGGSFPSGHSMGGIYAWTMVGVVLIYLLARPLGTVLGWMLIVFGVLMAPSRLILGVHWPSDVVAGWLFALGWVLLVSAVAVLLVAKRSLKEAQNNRGELPLVRST